MFNTLDSYGTSGADGFLSEGEMPVTTDSTYQRHIKGGNHSAKETVINNQETTGVINISTY